MALSYHLTNITPAIEAGLKARRVEYNAAYANTRWLLQRNVWCKMTSNAQVLGNADVKLYKDLFSRLNPPPAPTISLANLPPTNQSTSETPLMLNPLQLDGSVVDLRSDIDVDLFNATQAANISIPPPPKKSTSRDRHTQQTSDAIDSLFKSRSSGKVIGEFSKQFESNYTSQLRPLPGITRITVNTQGALGSLRTVKVDFNVWTKQQLDEIEPYFFIPGMSILVEWGWTIDTNNISVGPIPRLSSPYTEGEARIAIAQHRERHQGCYDGIQGLITNFAYSLNRHGGWDCQIEIVSAAQTFATVPAHSSTNQCSPPESETKNAYVKEPLQAHLDELVLYPDHYYNGNANLAAVNDPIFKELNKHVFLINFNAQYRDPEIDDPRKGVFQKAKDVFFSFDRNVAQPLVNGIGKFIMPDAAMFQASTTETFITFDLLIAFVNLVYGLKNADGSCQLVKFDITSNTFINPITNKSDNGVFIGSDDYVASTDPYTCILPDTPKISPFNYTYKGGVDSVRPSFPNRARLNDILLNVQMLREAYATAQDLKDFIRIVLDNVNDVCGSHYGLEIQEPPEKYDDIKHLKEVILTITNVNLRDRSVTVVPYDFRFDKKEMIDLSIKTKMTAAMKSQALYGTNSSNQYESTDISQNNSRFFRLAGLDGNSEMVVRNGAVKNPMVKNVLPCCPPGHTDVKNNALQALIEAYDKLRIARTDENSLGAKTALTTYFNEQAPTTSDQRGSMHQQNLILPLEVSVIIDGIGGIVWGNTISVDTLMPSRLGSMFYYQVTAVDQDISPANWKTTINTIPRFKS